MSDKKFDVQRVTHSKSKAQADSANFTFESKKKGGYCYNLSETSKSRVVHSPPPDSILKISGDNSLGLLNDTVTNTSDSCSRELNQTTVFNRTPVEKSQGKINFQIKGSPSLDYLKGFQYPADSGIVSSSEFNASRSICEIDNGNSAVANSTIKVAEASLSEINKQTLLSKEEDFASPIDEIFSNCEISPANNSNPFKISTGNSESNHTSVDKPPRMLPNNQKVSLRDALEVVPIFDGRNIPLAHFIEGCEEAKQMLPSVPTVELNLVKMIRSKIIGEARKSIYGITFERVDELINRLKKIYAPLKTVYQLQGELGSTYMWEKETVLSYATRIKEIADQILNAHRINNAGVLDETFETGLEKDLIQCFLRGLRPEIEIRVKKEDVFRDVTNNAIEIERRLSAVADLRKGNLYKQTPGEMEEKERVNGPGNKSIRVNHAQEEVITCQICHGRGHAAPTCRALTNFNRYGQNPTNRFIPPQNDRRPNHQAPPQPQQKPSIAQRRDRVMWGPQQPRNNYTSQPNFNPQVNPSQNSRNIICNYCKSTGHMIKDCRRREYNNKMREQQNYQQPHRNSGNEQTLPRQGAMGQASTSQN